MHRLPLKTVQGDCFKISMCLNVLVDWNQMSRQLTGLSPEDVSSVVVLRMGKGIITAC